MHLRCGNVSPLLRRLVIGDLELITSLKFPWLYHGWSGRLLALADAAGIGADVAVHVPTIRYLFFLGRGAGSCTEIYFAER
jgi:hypothetical protein